MGAIFEFLDEPRKTFFFKQDPVAAYQLLKPYLWKRGLSPAERRATVELAGLTLRAQQHFEMAAKLYQEIGDDYQAGYCFLLAGKLQEVRPFWARLVTQRPNHWCASLFGMLTHQVSTYPTLLQIRNHLESDITNFIQANQIQYMENLLMYADFLGQLNLEAYKFFGRALMNAGWTEKAESFLLQGQKALPNDPEIYFHLGQYSLKQNMVQEARLMLNQCLLISPTYTPAREALETLHT